MGDDKMHEGIRSKKSLSLGMHQHPELLSNREQATKLGDARVVSPVSSNDHRYFTRSYIFIRHILCVFAWSILYDMSLCLFCFLFWVMNPCWTHLFERAKIMSWLVRIALYASLKSFMSYGLALVLHLYLFEHGVL